MFENNVLLTQTERLMMSSRPKHPKYARNKNVLVIGGSGSGKTRFFVKPNLGYNERADQVYQEDDIHECVSGYRFYYNIGVGKILFDDALNPIL